jgi:hypothetical protein
MDKCHEIRRRYGQEEEGKRRARQRTTIQKYFLCGAVGAPGHSVDDASLQEVQLPLAPGAPGSTPRTAITLLSSNTSGTNGDHDSPLGSLSGSNRQDLVPPLSTKACFSPDAQA